MTLRIIEAKLFRNTEAFGKMDPYVRIEYNGKTYKTKTIRDGGMEPVWVGGGDQSGNKNSSFDILLKRTDDDMINLDV